MILRNRHSFVSGLLLVCIGVAISILGRNYPVGSATRMGPGYLPLFLSGALVLIGLFLAGWAFFAAKEESEPSRFRPVFFIHGAIIVFGLLIDRFGLFIAVPATVVVAAMALPASRVSEVLLIAAMLAVALAGVFVWGLGLPTPLWPR